MLAIERREHILSYLRQHEYANVEQLAEILSVSSMTVRRDLNKLEEQNLIKRIHGGATISQFINAQPDIEQRKQESADEKRMIAAYAANLVCDGHTILLDAGTTALNIAQHLTDKNIRVVTTDLSQALLLCQYKNIEVYITGGRVNDITQSCLGSQVNNYLDGIHVDIAFIGCTSWDLERGLTTPTEDRCTMKRTLAERAHTSVLVADSAKYGRYSFHQIMPLRDLDLIITDDNLPQTVQQALKESNISITIAPK